MAFSAAPYLHSAQEAGHAALEQAPAAMLGTGGEPVATPWDRLALPSTQDMGHARTMQQ